MSLNPSPCLPTPLSVETSFPFTPSSSQMPSFFCLCIPSLVCTFLQYLLLILPILLTHFLDHASAVWTFTKLPPNPPLGPFLLSTSFPVLSIFHFHLPQHPYNYVILFILECMSNFPSSSFTIFINSSNWPSQIQSLQPINPLVHKIQDQLLYRSMWHKTISYVGIPSNEQPDALPHSAALSSSHQSWFSSIPGTDLYIYFKTFLFTDWQCF